MLLMDIIRFVGKNYKVDQDAEKSWFGASKVRFIITIILSIILNIFLGVLIHDSWGSSNRFERILYIYGAGILVTFVLLLISEKYKEQIWAKVVNFFAWVLVLPFVVLRAAINRKSLEQKIGVKDTVIFEIVLLIDLACGVLISNLVISWSIGIKEFLAANFSTIMSGHKGEAVLCLIFIGLFKILLDVLCVSVYGVFYLIGFFLKKKALWLHKAARLFEINTSRGQLFILVFVFIYCTFSGGVLNGQESNIINILTIFTLIILLSDKNKEWAPEIEELLG